MLCDPYKYAESNLELIGYLHDDSNHMQLIDGGNGAKLSKKVVLREAQSVCNKLQSLGHQKGDCVLVMGNNTVEYVLSFLGILLAEGVVCPQAITKPEHECDYLLQDSGSVLVLGPPKGAEPSMRAAKGRGIPYVPTEFIDPLGEQRFELKPEPGTKAARREDNDARRRGILLYTSGTTGQPKGVPEVPRVMAKRLEIWRKKFDCTSKDSLGLIAPVASATGLLSTLLPMWCGGTLHLPGGGKFSAKNFWREACEYGMTQTVAVPTMLKLLIANAATDYPKDKRPPLRFMYSIGAALSATLHHQMMDTFGLCVYELYGMSELAVVSYNDPLDPKKAKPGSAGVPLPEYEIEIFNPDNKQVPKRGDAGEICVRGWLGFQGYHNKPEADKAGFIDDWFHTGDGGYIDENGFLEVTGRIKELISCGAIKYSPDEVDAVLHKHPEVAEAATFPVPESMLGQVPESVVVLRKEHEMTNEEAPKVLRKYAADNLQDYKVPVKVHVVDSIPKSDAAKVQRFELTKQYAAQANGDASHQKKKPREDDGKDILTHVKEGWEQELGTAPENDTVNFFSSGGGSMQAAALAGNLSDRLDTPIDSALIFSDPEPAKLATAIEKQIQGTSKEGAADADADLRPLTPEEKKAGIPLARTWRANYFTISANTGGCKIGVAAELKGSLDIQALRASHIALLERHESLRTVMKPNPGAPVPTLDIKSADEIQYFRVSEASSEEEAVAIGKDAWSTAYDQENGPLTRCQVIVLGKDHHWLLLPTHHGIADQMGTLIIQKDLASLYNACVRGTRPQLPVLPVQDADYMAWLEAQEKRGAFDDDVAYWKEQFSGPDAALQDIKVKDEPNTYDAELINMTISAKSLEHIREVAKDHKASIMTVIMAAYAESAAEALNQKGALASMVTGNRNHPALTDMVCSITTPVPVGMSLAGRGQLGKLLEQAGSQIAGAMKHSIPYHLIQEAAGPKAESLAFLSLNADLEMTKSALDLEGITATPLDAQRFVGLYAQSSMIAYRRVLMYFRANAEGGLTGGVAWNPRFLDRAQGEYISTRFQVLIDGEWN